MTAPQAAQRRNRNKPIRLMMGSSAERVVRHAPCPVLVVRAREHEFIKTKSPRRRKSVA